MVKLIGPPDPEQAAIIDYFLDEVGLDVFLYLVDLYEYDLSELSIKTCKEFLPQARVLAKNSYIKEEYV